MISDFSKLELEALAQVVELYEKMIDTLGRVEMYPRYDRFHIKSEVVPGYAGWIGYNEDGCIVFQPAAEEPSD